jgi:hypothetical protein
MPYHVGSKGSNGCSGYPAVDENGKVMGCHKTRSEAAGQIYAINLSEGNIGKSMPNLKEGDFAMTAHGSDEEIHIGQVVHVMREGMLGVPGGEYTLEASEENPAVLIQLFEQEENGYWESTNLYTGCMMSLMVAIDPLPQEPEDSEIAMAMYDSSIGKADPCWDGYVQRGMKEQNGKMVPNCVPVGKSDEVKDLGSFAGIGKDYTRSTKEIHRVEE